MKFSRKIHLLLMIACILSQESLCQVCLELEEFSGNNGSLDSDFWTGITTTEEVHGIEWLDGGCPQNINEVSPSGNLGMGCHIGAGGDNEGAYGFVQNLKISEEYCLAFYWTNLNHYCQGDTTNDCVNLNINVAGEDYVFDCVNSWTYIEICFVAKEEIARIEITGKEVTFKGYYLIDIAPPCECELRTILGLNLPDSIVQEKGDLLNLNPGIEDFEIDSFVWESTSGYLNGSDIIFNEIITSNQELQLTVYHNDCKVKKKVFVNTLDVDSLYLGNAFSPNSLHNDVFYVQASNETEVKINSMSIFDRWGDNVFNAKNFMPNDKSMGWDGTHKGIPVNAGVYVYYIVYSINGDVRMKKGDLMLLR